MHTIKFSIPSTVGFMKLSKLFICPQRGLMCVSSLADVNVHLHVQKTSQLAFLSVIK